MTLQHRLSLFFLGFLALVLVGFSVPLYVTASKYLHRQADERLEATLNTLVAAAEVGEEGVEWEPGERKLTFLRRIVESQLDWEISDPEGRRIDGSVLRSSPISTAEYAQSVGHSRVVVDKEGHSWRYLARWIGPEVARSPERPRVGHSALLIGAAVGVSESEATLVRLALLLMVLFTSTMILAGVVGRRLLRRALRPVVEMAESARSIRGDEIDRRLPSIHSGDELEQLATAFNGLLDRLEESHERQRRFTGDASHQLRTPLTTLQGEVDLALRSDRSGQEYRRVLGVLQSRTRHLRQIIESLLFLARTDTEANRPDLEPVDLVEWLKTWFASVQDRRCWFGSSPRCWASCF